MADADKTPPASQPGPSGEDGPRDSTTGRYTSGGAGQSGKADDGSTTVPAPDKDGKPKEEEKEGRKRWLLLLLLLLILLLLLCAGYSYLKWWKKDDPVATPSPTTVATATVAPKPTATATAAPPSPSASPTVKTVAMPNVVGKQAAEAKIILEAAGLTNVKFVAEGKPNETLSILVSFVVTQQSVPAGTQVAVDAAVVITSKSSSNGKG